MLNDLTIMTLTFELCWALALASFLVFEHPFLEITETALLLSGCCNTASRFHLTGCALSILEGWLHEVIHLGSNFVRDFGLQTVQELVVLLGFSQINDLSGELGKTVHELIH